MTDFQALEGNESVSAAEPGRPPPVPDGMLAALLLALLPSPGDCLPVQNGTWGPVEGDVFAIALATIGDVDGDGVDEFAIGCPMMGAFTDEPGRVWIMSPKSCRPRLELQAGGRADRFGAQLIAPGDLDGDRVGDVVATCAGDGPGPRVLAFSGKTGGRLPGPHLQPRGSALLCAVGDVNHDGRGDYAIAGTNPAPFGARKDPERRDRFGIVIVDGSTGETLVHLEPEDGQCWASAMIALSDLDGDGVDELVLAHSGSVRPIEIWSIGARKLLHTLPSLDTWSFSEITLAAPGDVDGDGVADLAIGLVSGEPRRSRVVLIDGYTRKELASIRQPRLGAPKVDQDFWSFGEMLLPLPGSAKNGGPRLLVGIPARPWDVSHAVLLELPGGVLLREHEGPDLSQGMYGVSGCSVGDADGDGVCDYVVGAANWLAGGLDPGEAYLYSGRSGKLLRQWTRAGIARR